MTPLPLPFNPAEGPGLRTQVVDPHPIVRDPLVGVVIIGFTREPYIAQAIEEVLWQGTDFPTLSSSCPLAKS